MRKYIGITIGPIFDMMSLVTSPGSLWYTSYMFSSISKATCEILLEKEVKIIAPFYEKDHELFKKNDGIGLFHDRVIMEADGISIDDIKDVKKSVFEKISKDFEIDYNDLCEYILYAAAEFEVAHPILDGGKILDSLELAKKTAFKEQCNPFLKDNENIKRIAKEKLNIDENKWVLINSSGKHKGNVKSLEDIASAGQHSGMKKNDYYAIVRADGDNMSKILEMTPVDKLPEFSEKCLRYCAEVSQMVDAFGGVTVYSSGDDLLALLPCESAENKTVFDFTRDVNKKFNRIFETEINNIRNGNAKPDVKKQKPIPSLSFGIFICFEKFPLYEALAESANLLFDIAKSKKNCLAIKLQKHSGQSEGLLIKNNSIEDYLKLQTASFVPAADNKNEGSANMVLLSALYKTELFEKLFNEATTKVRVDNLFKNVFDAPYHEYNSFVHKDLPDFYNSILSESGIIPLDESGIVKDANAVKAFSFALRILKFFVEKGGKKNEKNV